MAGKVKAICLSKKKGTAKIPVEKIEVIENYGFKNDAHAGSWHRQVSLLSYETRETFKQMGSTVEDGSFGENLLISGIDFNEIEIGTRLKIGDVILEITQVGKCIMPTNGLFSRVLKGGTIQLNDSAEVLKERDKRLRVAILTLSDKGSQGLREDLSGSYIQDYFKERGYYVTSYEILPDEQVLIEQALINLSDRCHNDLIITTGGTGLSMRDVTPEATLKVATRNVPGISEAIRYESMKYTNRAMLSRGVSVLRNQTLIINLPGSLKAVKESLDIIIDPLKHGLEILKGEAHNCARKDG